LINYNYLNINKNTEVYMAIDRYKTHAREDRELAHAKYIAHPDYPAAVKEAAARGFRPATIIEINRSAEGRGINSDLYRWKGGLWIRQSDDVIGKEGAQ
jgi:hypothetical protein